MITSSSEQSMMTSNSEQFMMTSSGEQSARFAKKAVILCGGKGTRMGLFTAEAPKPMLPVKGKPVLEHLLGFFRAHGICDIMLSVGCMKSAIMEYFGSGSGFGVSIKYIEEDSPLGTAGPLLLAKDMLRSSFIACNGDMLYNINLGDMLAFHAESKALATIGLTTVDDPQTRGVVELSGSRVLRFVEKSQNPPSNLINAGIYVMKPEIIEFIPLGKSMLEQDVFQKIADQKRLYGFLLRGQCLDVGTPERYKLAEKIWKGVD